MYSFVVPTRNRPAYLERLLAYYRGQRPEGPIVVADSSAAADLERGRGLVAAARADGLDVVHAVYPPETALFDKLVRALDGVATPCATLVGDDDFVLPTGARAAADYLLAHPTTSVCHGRAAVFTLGAGPDGGVLVQTYKQRAVRGASAEVRLAKHLGWYATTAYSMHRTADLRANLAASRDCALDYQFGELLPSCLSAIQGEIVKLDVLYMVREVMPTSEGRKSSGWRGLHAQPDFAARYARFRARLVEELARVTGRSPKAAGLVVDGAFLRVYLQKELYARPALRWARRAIDAGRRWTDRPSPPSTDPLRLERLLDPAHPDAAGFRPIYDLLRV